MNNTVILQAWGQDGWSLHLTVQDKDKFIKQWLNNLSYQPREQELNWQQDSSLTTKVTVKGNSIKKLKELQTKGVCGLRLFDKQDLEEQLTKQNKPVAADKKLGYVVVSQPDKEIVSQTQENNK